LHVAGVGRAAGDDHAVTALADRLPPIGTEIVGDARDVLHDDSNFSVHDSLDLEAHRGGRALLDDAEAEIDVTRRAAALVDFAQLFELDADTRGEHTPH